MEHHIDPTPADQPDAGEGDGTRNRAHRSLDRDIEVHYASLRALARSAVDRVRGGRALDPTELLHEGYLRLHRSNVTLPPRRTEFLAFAATVLRNCLVDQLRELRALKRGGDAHRITLTGIDLATNVDVDLLELDEAMQRLAVLDARQAQIVELKYFGGLSLVEIADFLDLGLRDVKADWTLAKAWLHRELCG